MQQNASGKKPTRKEKQAAHQAQPSRRQQVQQQLKVIRQRRWLAILVAVIGMVAYSNTLGHQYVLDDWGLIPENKITRKGFDGIGEIFRTSYRTGMDITDNTLYRPLSKATFAIEWALFPNNPLPGHLVNVLLYGITCFVLLLTLMKLFKGRWLEPFLAALLFAVHPLHTEVVANIKSRDEILSLLFLLGALYYSLNYAANGKTGSVVRTGICFFLALLAKESAITWIAVLPLALYFFTDAGRKAYSGTVLAAVAPTVLFLMIRASVLTGESGPAVVVDNYLNGIPDFLTQRTSAIALLGIYLFKCFVPYPLISDGSYSHFPPFPVGDWHFLAAFATFIGLAFIAYKGFRKKDPVSFSILYFFITISIVSNIVVLIGTNYAERLLFAPSLGWCIAIAVVIARLTSSDVVSEYNRLPDFFRSYAKPIGLTALVSLVFAFTTLARNRDWLDNFTLYKADLSKVSRSAHMRFYLANHITSEEFLAEHDDDEKETFRKEAIAQLDTAISIYPEYADAFQRRAFILFDIAKRDAARIDSMRSATIDSLSRTLLSSRTAKDTLEFQRQASMVSNRYDSLRVLAFTSRAEPDFQMALKYNPTQSVAHNNYGNLLFETRRFLDARSHFEQAVRYNNRYAHAYNNLASVYGVLGDGERQAAGTDPANRSQHLTNARQNYETALGFFRQAIQQDPEYYMPYYLMGVTYRNLGDEKTALEYIRKSEEVKQTKRYNAYN